MTKKEQQRLMVLNQVMVGELSKKQAAKVLDLSVRQVKRLVARYRKEGDYALVGHDNVVRFRDHRLQIEPSNERSSYARVRVEVHERMDGSIAVYYQGRCLVTKSAPLEAPVLRVSNIARVIPHKPISEQSATPVTETKTPTPSKEIHHTKPTQNHPWRRPFRMHIDGGRG